MSDVLSMFVTGCMTLGGIIIGAAIVLYLYGRKLNG